MTPHGTSEKVPPMVPAVFGTLGKAATPRETPTKETSQKSKQTPSKKGLMPDTTPEPPIKKQRTSLPSSNWGDDSEHGNASEKKKKKNEKVRPLQPLTRRPMRLRNSRRNANRQRSGNTSYRHSYGTGRATTSSCTIYHRRAAAATLGT